MDTQGSDEMQYSPGDHVAVYPYNSSKLVEGILARLQNAPPPTQLIKIEVLQERTTPLGNPLMYNISTAGTNYSFK